MAIQSQQPGRKKQPIDVTYATPPTEFAPPPEREPNSKAKDERTPAPAPMADRALAEFDEHIPRMEPWLRWMGAAFLPLFVALFLEPRSSLQLAFLGATGALIAVGSMLLGAQVIRRRTHRTGLAGGPSRDVR